MHFRDPNSPVEVAVPWPLFNTSHQSYIQLDKDMLSENATAYYMAARAKSFWLQVFPGLVDNDEMNIPFVPVSSAVGNSLHSIFMGGCVTLGILYKMINSG